MVSSSLLIGLVVVAVGDRDGKPPPTDPSPAEIAGRLEETWKLPAGLAVRYKQKINRLPDSAGCDAYFCPFGDETEFTLQGDRFCERDLLLESPPTYTDRTFDGDWFYQKQMIARDRLKGPSAIGTGPSPNMFMKTHRTVMEGVAYYFEMLGTMPYEGRGNITAFHRELYLRRLGGDIDPAKKDGVGRPLGLVAALRGGRYKIVGGAQVGGDNCLELQGPGDRVWLDPKHDYALRRRVWDWLPGTSHQFDVTLNDLRAVSPGLWLPWNVHVDRYAAPVPGRPCPGRPVVLYDLEVIEAKLGPFPDETFQPKPERGALVRDESLVRGNDGEEVPVLYNEGETPEETQEALDRALRGQHRVLREGGRMAVWLSAGATAVAIVYVAIRMRKSKESSGGVT